MLPRLPAALALVSLVSALCLGAAEAQTTYQPPPPYEPPPYAPPPYTPSQGVQQQSLPPPPPRAPGVPAPSTAELPLGAPSPPAPPAGATRADAATAIRDAINGWADDFNALKTGIVCDIFAPDLHYDFGVEPGDYNSLCKRLRQALGEAAFRYHYAPEIREILISGDLAVVNIVWTLTVTRNGHAGQTVVTEPAMYVMRHEPDGNWRVFRFLAFNVPNPQAQH